ncbi:PEP-utilizing enzyme [Catellatospora paridis]|uniref:PEP-utilizing enzyme n=1 Tax=Catellatospora paridis TaxID=1617086 RepID=UPI0012D3EB32|nr:PEP-utilizing enzyme [Catellatospora paridis]
MTDPTPDVVTGVPSSPGRASGPARVVRSLADFARVRPGDVLVCRTTDPAWTPLFRLAAAVVAETGGLLSHAAIVAREYRIPAVVGASGAMTRLVDGARISVDGTLGTVAADETP